MRRRTKFNINPKHLLIACSVLLFLLIILSFLYKEQLSPVKTVFGNVVTPMQNGINSIGKGIAAQFDKFTSLNELRKENAELKEQLDTISHENKILLQDKYELDRFRDLYELDKKYADYPKVGARVIGAGPNNGYNIFTIDKGSRDGIAVDMNVIAGDGLVGIVEEVGKNYATVRSIIDDSRNISGMFLKTSDSCIVNGNLQLYSKGVIGVELISKDAEVYDGYEVVTSHISPKYLQGILIGYVSNIKMDSNNLTKTAYLTPAVDFDRLEEVLIITEVKEKLEK
ncbi:cell shape-determining protein MreC [Anaerocolumna cellulosilytica]|uniref:Cell shape-determining protein MreC n=1 Tax=Anaerocolumna cellulosilytica TaxID=433286 RepID=A0A6S6R130_9FIRM|nr:rod shape-determining protein MreC [Anaerocolumna cellulosilytica]MBB5193744.1 rod shape-determining protein MreC [Anaerocolumna cellulosilytica]BCJ95039.1 cell shape-determining protein MreC [Anaerocolumna cellulosilytica]